MVLIDELSPYAPTVARTPDVVDERAARRTLRGQITRLERELGETILAAFPHVCAADASAARRGSAPSRHVREPDRALDALPSGPRLLGLGELERVRDDLAERLRAARVVVARRADLEAASRALLEEMLREPARHKWVRLRAADLGERGCGAYQVRPRLGLVGMLMGWWHVKLSSGCPRPAPA